ncbi:MAG: YihY/virulence factor BrkB family protein [Gammaproteobacteria bacterium]
MLTSISDLVRRYLWERDHRDSPVLERVGVSIARTFILVGRDVLGGELNLRAMSLVYTTLLSLVPLLALSFSILKGFGVQNQLDETLRAALAPLGEAKAAELAENLIGFVNNMNVGVLGAVGLLFLMYTVVSLMQKIEAAFNHVWRVRTPRTFGERFTTFLSAVTVGPLLVFAAIAVTGTVMSTTVMGYLQGLALIGPAIEIALRLVPFALVIGAFTFLYVFIPNTRVRLVPALIGGMVAGVLWELLSFGFASYASGASNYQLVYATFATAIFFMIWLYLNWLILLIGASIAFYRQHPHIVTSGLLDIHLNPLLAERYALSLLAKVGKRFYAKEPAYTLSELATHYDIPVHALEECLAVLVDIGVLAETDGPLSTYIPSVPFDSTTVAEVLERLDSYQPPSTYAPSLESQVHIAAIEDAARKAREKALAGLTLKDMALNDVGATATVN